MSVTTWTPDRILELRQRRSLTQTQLAEHINDITGQRLHRHAIANWERGAVQPGTASRMALDQIEQQRPN